MTELDSLEAVMILNERTSKFNVYEIFAYNTIFQEMIERPLVFFDVETTGLSFKDDRLLSLSAYRFDPNHKARAARLDTYFDPGVDVIIHPKITKLIGISRETVNDAPIFSSVAEEIAIFFRDADLAGYNVQFDIQFLEASFARSAVASPFREDVVTFDPYRVFRKMYSHDLSTCYSHYCNAELEDAHSSLADIEATIEIGENQIYLYDWEDSSLDQIREQYRAPYLDDDEKFYLDDDGKVRLGFGKNRDKLLASILMSKRGDDRSYVQWMFDNLASDSRRVLQHYVEKLKALSNQQSQD